MTPRLRASVARHVEASHDRPSAPGHDASARNSGARARTLAAETRRIFWFLLQCSDERAWPDTLRGSVPPWLFTAASGPDPVDITGQAMGVERAAEARSNEGASRHTAT